ncbi:hypothetical protein V9J15_04755 [Candidatus Liberibacter africanus]|uniref:Uncharacterized protein n=1 Tax=Candidatus Liberibacter africanus PTSAPSY TaxID=1277257 RepID=A0A0G3I7T0_LIBAF|nr:hypothetical protein [Candidatus Liberibacter africanus]AKK20588.1 hypothetical protein G293_04865 [Candidatus Liberibacter africanus PTSAPSY]
MLNNGVIMWILTVMGILAVDIGCKMGFVIQKDGNILSGTVRFENGRFEGGGMKFLKFQNWLDKLEGIKVVWFEEVRRHLGVDASHAYDGFLAVLVAWCEKNQIAYGGVPVQTIKNILQDITTFY